MSVVCLFSEVYIRIKIYLAHTNVFNDHFSTLGAKVQQKIPLEQGDFRDYLKKKGKDNKAVINPEGHCFFLSPTVPFRTGMTPSPLQEQEEGGP